MTLEDLRDHLVRQVSVFEAYFDTDGQDGKTAKSYRKSVQEAKDRLEVVSKILVDGYTPSRHSQPVTNDNPGDLTNEQQA